MYTCTLYMYCNFFVLFLLQKKQFTAPVQTTATTSVCGATQTCHSTHSQTSSSQMSFAQTSSASTASTQTSSGSLDGRELANSAMLCGDEKGGGRVSEEESVRSHGQRLCEGEYDEAESAASFQEALAEWRALRAQEQNVTSRTGTVLHLQFV